MTFLPPSRETLLAFAQEIISEMRTGISLFIAFCPSIDPSSLQERLESILTIAKVAGGMECSTWGKDTTSLDWEKSYQLHEYVEFFESGKISQLNFDFHIADSLHDFWFKLLFAHFDEKVELEIICNRNALLCSSNPVERFEIALGYCLEISRMFNGEALFVSADTSNYPISPEDDADGWLRIV